MTEADRAIQELREFGESSKVDILNAVKPNLEKLEKLADEIRDLRYQ